MTTKMKGVRGQPLLEAPADLRSLDVSAEDIEVIKGALSYFRRSMFKNALANTYRTLSGIGYPQQIPEEDNEDMLKCLEETRGREKPAVLPTMLHNMKELRLVEGFTEDDREKMFAKLAEERDTIRKSSGGLGIRTEFFNMMRDIDAMRELGLTVGLEGNEGERLLEYLSAARKEGHGANIAETMYYLSKFGMRQDATDYDTGRISRYLNNLRTSIRRLRISEDSATHIANMHLWIRETINPQPDEIEKMPPLKKLN